MPQSKCVLCDKRLKVHQRRPVNKHISKYLKKRFLLNSSHDDFICGKCSRPAYEQPKSSDTQIHVLNQGISESQLNNVQSPPSVHIKINSATKSHAYCFICKKPGPKLIVVPVKLRTDVFLKQNILITAESRCCPVHLNNTLDKFNPDVLQGLKNIDHAFLNRTAILDLLHKTREIALKSQSNRMSFHTIDSYSDIDLENLTGLNKEQFLDLFTFVNPYLRNTPARTAMTTLGLYLFKMKSRLSNKLLSTLFNVSKSSVRRALHSVRTALMQEFVPSNLGFQSISREEVINNHTRVLAQQLLAENEEQAILVLDGTYIYINKSNNFHFQRRSYSVHKGRPLVKMMIIVTTTGHFVSVLGPYFADVKNNDASILKHIMSNNIEEVKSWMKTSDIFVVDRGFRDSLKMLEDLGIHAEIPAFMVKGQKQMTQEDANASRLVTKVRGVVEAANARIKHWKYFDHILPTTQVPHIGDNVRIVCAVSNKYFKPINATKDSAEDQLTADRMLDRVRKSNELQQFVEENNLDRRSISRWAGIEDCSSIGFPVLDETMLRLLTLGTYQLKLSSSYIQEYVNGECDFQLFQETDNLLRVRLQSRHISSKSYLIWIKYDSDHVQGWYCKCRAGARTVGTCSHIAGVLWYLGMAMYSRNGEYGVKDWCQYVQDASAVPEQIDSSDSDESVVEE